MMTTSDKLAPSLRSQFNKEDHWGELEQLSKSNQTLNLGIGFPDFAAPPQLRQDFRDVVDGTDFSLHQYTKGFGHPRLCRALCSLYAGQLHRPTLDPNSEVVVTNGASEALFAAIMGLVNPGDEVIIIEPFFDCYEPQVKLAGGTPVFVSLRPRVGGSSSSSEDWILDPEELEAAFTANTKAILVNTPHNPTGKVFSRAELELIAGLCRSHGAVVISDEVYEWLTYGPHEHVRMATLPGMWERTITIGSAGKTFSVTGWKIGWMLGPSALLAGPKVVHQNCGYLCNTPLQEALARGFERETALLLTGSPDCYFKSLAVEAEKKRDLLASSLADVGITPIIPQGSYFILADIRDLMSRVDVGGSPEEAKDFRFLRWLAINWKLQGIPSSLFFSIDHKSIGENYMRFCFLKEDSTLLRAGEILKNLKMS